MGDKLLIFLKSAFSEPDGTGSACRVLAATVILSTIVWVSYLVFFYHDLPDLTSAALFVGAGFSGYAVNRVSCAIKEAKDDK